MVVLLTRWQLTQNKENKMEILDLNDEEIKNESASDKDFEPEKDNKGNKKNKKDNKEETSAVKEILSWIFTLAIAVVAAMLIKNYVIINANIPSGSMENTIMPGDDIFGFRLAYTFSEPKRGDIVIFNAPDDPSEKYIKRVIGLPGETVTIENAQVYINGEPLEEDYLKDEEWVNNAGPYEFQVPENSYLMLGDNRNGSSDARVWQHTYVTKDEIVGKAILRYYPFNRFGIVK